MKPLFHSRLLNAPFGDPVLYIEILHKKQALLFDIGDLSSLREAKILKVSHVFVTHTHMDHFFGFDHLLRVILGRDKNVTLFGPPGIISNVAGKLSGYTWNLVKDYSLQMRVCEVHPQFIQSALFICSEQFRCETGERIPFDCVLEENPHFKIESVHLDHGIPCLAFSLAERFHININKDNLIKLGFSVGAWLRELKEHIWEDKPESTIMKIPVDKEGKSEIREVALGDLKREIVKITPGQKIAYVVDCCYSRENLDKIVGLVQGADIFFCEASFLEEDRDKARAREHLTARQAGLIARRARVKVLNVFHFSPRYEECPESLDREAQMAFKGG
ncbi:MAG: MBL fold metallo-hydrolase [Deltaproteobacteria bacterium]|nr:MBL fold metallo-hydrolase [Deltaproteobacteria bacterium]